MHHLDAADPPMGFLIGQNHDSSIDPGPFRAKMRELKIPEFCSHCFVPH